MIDDYWADDDLLLSNGTFGSVVYLLGFASLGHPRPTCITPTSRHRWIGSCSRHFARFVLCSLLLILNPSPAISWFAIAGERNATNLLDDEVDTVQKGVAISKASAKDNRECAPTELFYGSPWLFKPTQCRKLMEPVVVSFRDHRTLLG